LAQGQSCTAKDFTRSNLRCKRRPKHCRHLQLVLMAEQSPLHIQEVLRVRTSQGPVGLREPRKRGAFKFDADGGHQSGEPKTIVKDWLKGAPEASYHTGIKQGMLIAAQRIAIFDASDRYGHTFNKEKEEQAKQRLHTLLAGRERIQVSHFKRTELKNYKKREEREKDNFVKFGQSCLHGKKMRQFIIENGQMVVYLDNQLKDTYKLETAVVTEEPRQANARPRFEAGVEKRLRVAFDERTLKKKEDIFIYPSKNKTAKEQDQQIKRWKRSFQMARLLKSEVDRKALRMVIGRATSGALVKGWEALFLYAKEIRLTRDLARQMASRLIKSDLARGWTKMKVLHQKWKDEQERRKQQQIWAARFMCERLTKMGVAKAKAADEIRDGIITKIQQTFRKYREASIMDREYALDSSKIPPMKKGRQGQLMDIALEALTCEEALCLSLKGSVLEHYKANRSSFETRKSTYSAAPTADGRAMSSFVFLADNLTSLSFTLDAKKPAKGQEHLTKADWANFINLDRISSVVMHSTPLPGCSASDKDESRLWLTINGPRVSFGKRPQKSDAGITAIGAEDPLSMPKALTSRKQKVRWVTMKVSVGDANVAAQTSNPTNAPSGGDEDAESGTFAVIHVMDYSFKTKVQKGGSVDQSGTFEATAVLPLAVEGDEDKTFAFLDTLRVGIEVFETPQESNEIEYANKLRYVGSTRLLDAFGGQQSFTKVLPSSSGTVKVPLGEPTQVLDGKADAKTYITLNLEAQVEEKPWEDRDKRCCVSPELMGAGLNTSVFTSHRGVWFDPKMGLSKFNVAHVGNFIELSLNGLRFPPSDIAGKGTYRYRVRALVDGFYTHSSYLHRAKDGWEHVLGPAAVDTTIIEFQGTRLYLPLPPACWGEMPKPKAADNATNSAAQKEDLKAKALEPAITIEIWRFEVDTAAATDVNFREFISGQASKRFEADLRKPKAQEQLVYKSLLRFEKIPVDVVTSVSAFLTEIKAGTDPQAVAIAEISVNHNSVSANEDKVTEGLLNIDFALRDWDYVKAVSMIGEETGAHEQTALCVGEKAMLCCEEPMVSPNGSDPKRFIKKPWKGLECPLREPCLSSEYADSGLEDCMPDHPFNQSIIPNYCEDIIPHKYVMPLTEQKFRAKRLPGVYWRVMDSLVPKDGRDGRRNISPAGTVTAKNRVVTTMTHVVKHVPMTLLAVYPDETCDVEIDAEFLKAWQSNGERRYSIPGVFLRNHSLATDRREKKRCILQKVPLLLVVPVQSAGFNIYDSSCRRTEDVLALPGQQSSHKPTKARKNEKVPASEVRYTVAAGPLPPDSTEASCLYEWRLHIQAKSEMDLHQFVQVLRQAAKVTHFQQAVKMMEYYKKGTAENQSLALANTMARRTKPRRDPQEEFLKEIWPRVIAQRAREPTTGIEAQYLVYNANLARGRVPETPAFQKQRYIEMLVKAARQQMDLDQQQEKHWKEFEQMCADERIPAVYSEIRLQSFETSLSEQNGQGPANRRMMRLQELIEGGIPCQFRQRIWLELTMADQAQETESLGSRRQQGGDIAKMAELEYKDLVAKGSPQNSDAMLQLTEDCFHMASWETGNPVPAEFMNLHMTRVKQAADICTALITIPPNAEQGGIVYCESLLVIAYFLMLPQSADDRMAYIEKHSGMSESSAFWLLYTLIRSKKNRAFKEYFGTEELNAGSRPALCVTSGAMEDIHLLDMCLAYHKAPLWNFFNAIGFQLASVFYGAFMRLFATYMPTLTVYRFWDILFAHTADPRVARKPNPNPRDPLISLAYGIIMVTEKELMQCKSASEVRDVLLQAMGAMPETSMVVDITTSASSALWGQSNTINPMKASGLQVTKVFDYAEKRKSLFAGVNQKLKDQNRILKLLMQTAKLGALPERKEGADNNQAPGVTTKKLLRSVLPTLQFAVDRQFQQAEKTNWTMHRPMPLALRHFEEDTVLAPLKNFYKSVAGLHDDTVVPFMVPPLFLNAQDRQNPKYPLEAAIDQPKFLTIIKQQIPSWDTESGELWRAFCNWHEGEFPSAGQRTPEGNVVEEEHVAEGFLGNMRKIFNPTTKDEDRGKPWHERVVNNAVKMASTPQQAKQPKVDQCLSMHDLFTAFILSSRGTVAEKASALFNIYGYMERAQLNTEVYHAVDITRLAKSMASTTTASSEGDLQRSPHPEPVQGQLPPEATKNALKFVIMSDHPKENTEIGQVLIPSLDPFIVYSQDMIEQAVPRNFIVWGKPLLAAKKDRESEKTVVMAEMEMAVAWNPKSINNLHEGQLFLHLKHIRFVEDNCSDYYRQNPYVKVFTQFHGRSSRTPDEPIEKWDISHARASDGQQTIIGRLVGTSDKHLVFHASMVKGMGGRLSQPTRNGKDMGFDSQSRMWLWNDYWGKMYSKPGVTLDRELFTGPVNRKTTMDMQGVRILVAAVLRRCVLNLTNRQQLLLADSLFHRQRVTPGILEACIAPKGSDDKEYPKGKDKTDVTALIVLEHEKQLANGGGFINLFRKEYINGLENQRIQLASMGINPGRYTTLYVKYVRAGDGERCIKAIDISKGYIAAEDSEVDMEVVDDWPQTKITKEEFIACVLNSPVLAEPIRRLGEQTDKLTQPSEAIALEVTLSDPSGKDEERLVNELLQEQERREEKKRQDLERQREQERKRQDTGGIFRTGMSFGPGQEQPKTSDKDKEPLEDQIRKRLQLTEIKLKFGPKTEGTALGSNHGIEVFLGDSIYNFKEKVTQACRLESERLEGEGRYEDSANYSDVLIGHKHLVMAFVPSAQVTRLYAQGLHHTSEYQEAYQKAVNDPSSWQPLEAAMTFNQYAATFGFGRAQAQLRVVLGTEAYKRTNLRFKKFDEESRRMNFRDTNNKTECFGYVKVQHHIHTEESPEEEWRQAIVKADPSTAGQQKTYTAKWLLPRWDHDSSSHQKTKKEATKSEVPQSDVILAPRYPLIDGNPKQAPPTSQEPPQSGAGKA